MSRSLVLILLGGLVGFVLGVTVGTWVAGHVLGSTADGGLRAARSGVFVVGPLLAFVGAITGALTAARR